MNKLKMIFKCFKETHRLEKRLIPISIVAAVSSAVMPFINIRFSAKIIDLLTEGAALSQTAVYIVAAVLLNALLFFLTNFFEDIYYTYRTSMRNRETKNIASRLFAAEYKRLEDSSFKELIHKHTEAERRVYSAFVQLSWMMRDFISGTLTVVISVIILIPMFRVGFTKTGESFYERPVFLLSIIGAILIMMAVILVLALRMNKAYFKANDEYSGLNRLLYYFIDLFSDYRTGKEIRLYKQQGLIKRISTEKIFTDGERILKKAALNSARQSSVVAVLGAAVGFGVYLFIGIKGLFGAFGIGSLVLYCGSFMQVIAGVMKMAVTFGKTEEMLPLADYYFQITEAEDEMKYGERELDLSKPFDIEFKNVSFTYPGSDSPALKNVSLRINSGERLAVVGRNGSGKTTFIKLLCRLYDADEGEILLGGVNIREYTKESVMRLYSVVFQDYSVFAVTLAQNIGAGDEVDEKRLWASLDEASVKDRVLSMPEKENTYLYKNLDKQGVEISGGEAQKIALARALYKDAPVVILDEPTAALDPIAENEIYTRFNSFCSGKTAIYISHRLSSCVFCDRIAVFDKAELCETGTHEALLGADGQYSRLWNAQAKYYSV